MGCNLTNLLDNPAIVIAPRKKGWSLLPLLVVLFLLSYGLMTMLIVEQGHTIQSQRRLIIDLFHDSATLSAIQGKIVQDNQKAQAQAKGRAQAPSAQTPSTQIPSTQIPSTQTPQTPSSQAAPQNRSKAHAGKTGKPEMQLPAKPASDLMDQRRALRTI